MREFINIGPTPPDEPCAQVGDKNYVRESRFECRRYIELLREVFGDEPKGAELAIKTFQHDFGDYREVICWYDPEMEDSVSYALACEDYGPITWDDKKKRDYKTIKNT